MTISLHNIALIGVRLMGHDIAKNLLCGGYGVRLFEHSGDLGCIRLYIADLLEPGASSSTHYTGLMQGFSTLYPPHYCSPKVEAILSLRPISALATE